MGVFNDGLLPGKACDSLSGAAGVSKKTENRSKKIKRRERLGGGALSIEEKPPAFAFSVSARLLPPLERALC